jgi:hypothetical protein
MARPHSGKCCLRRRHQPDYIQLKHLAPAAEIGVSNDPTLFSLPGKVCENCDT